MTDHDLAALREARDAAVDLARRRAEFIAHASHEIRAPLHSIVGYSTLLLGTELTGEQRSFAQALRTSVDALLEVVTDVLDLSQLDAEALRLESVTFDLVGLVRGVAEMCGESAAQKGLTLRVETGFVEHALVRGDPGRLRQVLVNLVGNAVKFTDHGSVTLRARARVGSPGYIEVELSVADTGPGIAPEDRDKLFKPFSRLGATAGRSTGATGGAGLGLAISKQLAERMGGSLRLDSSSGDGSTFALVVTLPEGDRAAAPAAMSLADAPPLRVYVADDDARSRHEVSVQLEAAGLRVSGSGAADSLHQALDSAAGREALPDAALVGHVRSEGGALAIARAVKADPRLAEIPLVLVPMSGLRGQALDAREAGFGAYLPRPFQPSALAGCVRALVSSRAAVPGESPLVTRHNVPEVLGAGHSPRALVVDDDGIGRRLTHLYLEQLGFEVDEAGDGHSAVEAAAGGDYRVVLMDCHMPGLDGPGAVAEIRRREAAGRRTFIVALSADLRPDLRARCRAAGMDDFLEKPLGAETLAVVLERHRGHVTQGQTARAGRGSQPGVTTLGAIEAAVGQEMALDLVADYLRGVEQVLEQLAAVPPPEPETVRADAHRLLGSARTLGLDRFAELWAGLDQRPLDSMPFVTPADLGALRAASVELRSWLDTRKLPRGA